MCLLRVRGRIWHDDEQQITQMVGQIVELQDAAAFGRAHIPDGQQPGEITPPLPRGGIGDDVRRTVRKHQP